ncbi:hypothetical protein AURANDRAFT_67471 [Aureococcus anophagefferens]|uniref:Uncharacterized protein n=1 Tax=Aureococcus anophagefferens TaxID=44056 RepID=F0YL98_AURAN|nr:hypothetical protein AURANDRAFT_67471 [Aureococcus anophagefferens]EGB04059.1 hypothetical protein AURANDRAFT_67471 [Aureococcus anophagefferens]|eukprot:XP_009041184.1 hypothetical protein AURANDRAFT_67471 [Aureococcus anophagefferens]
MDNRTAPDAPVKEKRTKGYVKFKELTVDRETWDALVPYMEDATVEKVRVHHSEDGAKVYTFEAGLSNSEKNMIMRALGRETWKQPEELGSDQWMVCQRTVLLIHELKKSKMCPITGRDQTLDAWHTMMIYMVQNLYSAEHRFGGLWATITVQVLTQFSAQIGQPWKWVCQLDTRAKLSIGDIQNMHDITVKLTDQWFVSDFGRRMPRKLRGNWIIPHHVKLRVKIKEATAFMSAMFKLDFKIPANDMGIKIHDGDYAALGDFQNGLEIYLQDNGLNDRGHSNLLPSGAIMHKETGLLWHAFPALNMDLLSRLKSQLALLEKSLVGNVLGYEELDEDDYEELGVLEFLDKPQLLQEVEAALRNKYVSALPKDQGRTFHIGFQPTGVNEAMERTKALKKTAMDLHVKDYESMSASALVAAIEPLMVCCYDILRLREKLECCKGNDDALVILVEDARQVQAVGLFGQRYASLEEPQDGHKLFLRFDPVAFWWFSTFELPLVLS